MGKRRVVYALLFIFMFAVNLSFVFAEKIDIDVENNYLPGENVEFKSILYGDDNEKIQGDLNFKVQNYYTEVIKEGSIQSGENVILELPENAIRGIWKITVVFRDIEKEGWFTVGELERAEIRLEGSNLIVTNVGNVAYGKPISILIGDHSETALVRLAIGQTKEIKLTAPEGEYDVSISDGTEENTFDVKGVSLTGNVIGLEKLNSNFWKEYPLVSLFLGSLVVVILIVVGLKIYNKVPN